MVQYENNRQQIQIMYYQSGSMRDINNDFTPVKNSIVYDRQNQFEYAQRSKYQKSEVSYIQQQKTKVIYQQQKSNRMLKSTENKQNFFFVPIKIKSCERQEYMNTFKIQVLTVIQKNNNCIIIHITNQNDSLFLWSFFLRQSEYLNLKSQQYLKTDFHEFPEIVENYLGCCIRDSKQPPQINAPLFGAVLQIKKGSQQAQFKISQSNRFKQSLHLSLKFKKANDEQGKVFLSQKFDKQRKQNIKLTAQLAQCQHKLNIRMQQLQKIHAQFQQMQRQKSQKISQLEKRQKQKLKQLTLRLEQQNIKSQKSQTEKTTKNLQDLNDKLQQLREKNEQLLLTLQKANERVINLQSSQSTLKSKCAILEQQCDGYEKSNRELKAKQLKNSQEYHALRNQNTRLACNIDSLEDKIKERDQRLTQNIEQKSNNFNQIANLEQNLRQEKQKNGKLEEKIGNLENQIAKLQNKYEELNNKYQKKKDKFNDYKEILKMQEQSIQNAEQQKKEMKQKLADINRQKEKAQLQLKDRQIKIKDLKNHIEQNSQHIEDQKKIIQSLNKRLNEKTLGVKSMAIASTLPTYTGYISTGIVGRDFSSTLSSTSQSRIKYSPSPISTSPLNDKLTERVAPPFRKYRQGIQNAQDQQNSSSFHSSSSNYNQNSHSRSPIANKLSQQLDPEDVDRTKEKIGPIKFKRDSKC